MTSDAEWIESLTAKIESMPVPRTPRLSVGVNLTPEQHEAILDASEARGLSLSSFTRRAALAVAVFDLDLDWLDLLKDEQPSRGFAESDTRLNRKLEGYGKGAWKIMGMDEYLRG